MHTRWFFNESSGHYEYKLPDEETMRREIEAAKLNGRLISFCKEMGVTYCDYDIDKDPKMEPLFNNGEHVGYEPAD